MLRLPNVDLTTSTQRSHVGADNRNVRLQYLRALAALAVLLFHVSGTIQRLSGVDSYIAIFNGYWGAYGVAIFFALSGYLMAELIRRDDAPHFLVSRLARIYPPLFLVVALFSGALLAIGFPRGVDILGLSLIPAGGRDYFLNVEWTLVYEMTYYTALGALAFLGLQRFASAFAALWILLILGRPLWGDGYEDNIVPVLSELPWQTVNLPFLFGFLLRAIVERHRLPPGIGVAALVAVIAAPYVIPGDVRVQTVIPAVLLVAAAVRAPLAKPGGALGRIGLKLGDASYVLYLSHIPLLLLLGSLLPTSLSAHLVFIGCSIAAILLSLVLAQADLGMHRSLKSMIARASAARLRVVALGFIAVFAAVAVYAERDVHTKRSALARAEAILSEAKVGAYATVRAEVDSADRLPDGSWLIRGYAIDLEKPGLVTHAAILQQGRIVAIDRMRRMRAAVAASLARPDLSSIRFGFALSLPATTDCNAGPLEIRIALEDGRLVTPASEPMRNICN
ncbi:acyltransferase [Bosea caraganae]|uniref:Acyltransferase n=1 Tax=Bosea caraganae TaxID=2763117 RepID=A0A370KXI1_9HYPH|nr:acyltransferase [Bosea caraganae]RDJ19687.1 acyltransferase [Bosea caraganae]RDJ24331.1 acyltransferase [Bosea caraganae]